MDYTMLKVAQFTNNIRKDQKVIDLGKVTKIVHLTKLNPEVYIVSFFFQFSR